MTVTLATSQLTLSISTSTCSRQRFTRLGVTTVWLVTVSFTSYCQQKNLASQLTLASCLICRATRTVFFENYDNATPALPIQAVSVNKTRDWSDDGNIMSERYPLVEKALSEGYARFRFKDTSLLIWQQQQMELEQGPPSNYLSRSQSTWYSQYGNQAVVVRDKRTVTVDPIADAGSSRICLIM